MFNNLAGMFRGLTATPAAWAIHEAHRMARRRVAAGGASAASNSAGVLRNEDFVLPADVNLAALSRAIEAGLPDSRARETNALCPIIAKEHGGNAVVRQAWLLPLGGGDAER